MGVAKENSLIVNGLNFRANVFIILASGNRISLLTETFYSLQNLAKCQEINSKSFQHYVTCADEYVNTYDLTLAIPLNFLW